MLLQLVWYDTPGTLSIVQMGKFTYEIGDCSPRYCIYSLRFSLPCQKTFQNSMYFLLNSYNTSTQSIGVEVEWSLTASVMEGDFNFRVCSP